MWQPVALFGIAGVCLIGVYYNMPPKKEAILQETQPKSAEYSPSELETAVVNYINLRTQQAYSCGAMSQACQVPGNPVCLDLGEKCESLGKLVVEAGKELTQVVGKSYKVIDISDLAK